MRARAMRQDRSRRDDRHESACGLAVAGLAQCGTARGQRPYSYGPWTVWVKGGWLCSGVLGDKRAGGHPPRR